ncbi:hypothetical protein VB773_22395 [Haloarculaceae archaeon H-GB2-1]|nr:hypothetical protein [Haloarculaceae archaeon H-GB11]MEA5410050.1 hypothetical protein [Haloarculaceae archaeon H-GB2-1]
MSAAIQSATTDRTVGIDGPSVGFVRKLLRTLRRDRASLSTVRSVVRGVLTSTKKAALCRVADAVATRTSLRVEVDAPVVYDSTRSDEPARQAANEERQVGRAESILDALVPTNAADYRDSTRETHMADRIETLRDEGSVVAVVGYAHLDPVAERLDDHEE